MSTFVAWVLEVHRQVLYSRNGFAVEYLERLFAECGEYQIHDHSHGDYKFILWGGEISGCCR